MPIYEYQCKGCKKVFEFIQRMSDDPKTECEECHGELARMISQSAFHLKGGGWYKDLYASTPKTDDSTAKAAPATTTSDAKPAAASSSDSATSSSPTPTKTEPKAKATPKSKV